MRTDEEVEIHRRADSLRVAPGRERHPARGRVPAAGRQRSHLLHLEEEVRPPGRQRAPEAAIARGRECPAEAPRRRPHARQAHARGGVEKKGLRPARRRELAAWFQATYGVKVQRACHLAQFSRTAWYRRSTARDQRPLRMRIRELAHARPRFGYLRIWVLLRREGWRVNKKRVRRLYRLEGPAVAHAGPPAEAHRATSRSRAAASGSDGALEHGFRPRRVGQRPAVSG